MRSLKERDIETLLALRGASDDAIKHDTRAFRSQGWARPLDCGGSNGSHHSQTLAKLARYGLADRHKFGGRREKGSCNYRINDTGRTWLIQNGYKVPNVKT